ncbi:MAG: DUF4190 domain-containing protein [Pirellulaceae bacterium]
MSSSFPPSPDKPNPFAYNPPSGNFGPGGQPGGQQFGGQQFGGGGFGLPPYQPKSLTLPALFSLVLSIGSPVFLCLCLPIGMAVTSLVGIVLGHVALVRIGRSQGTLSGGGLAIGGLVIGYPMFLLGAAFFALSFIPHEPVEHKPFDANAPSERLKAAERKINTDNEGIAHGNSPAAKALAEKYAKTMKELREAFFTKGKGGPSLSGGNFVTYCELHDGRCAFVTHVPEYRKFEGDAKESLAEIAWEAAQMTVADSLAEGDDLGVGLKGVVLYGKVMVGRVTIAGDEKRGLEHESKSDEARLEPFFEIDPEEVPKDPPIKLDEPGKAAEPEKPAEPTADSEAKP